MPSLAQSRSALGPGGLPRAFNADYGGKVPAVPRSYTSTFSRLGPGGLPASIRGSYSGKVASTSDGKYVSDTLTLRVIEDPIDDVTIEVNDQLSLVIGESAFVAQARSVSDTVTLRVTDAVNSLLKSGTIAKAGADTLRITITEGVSLRVQKAASDTLTLVVTEGSSVGKADNKTVSDTLTFSISEVSLLNAVLANVSRTVTDTLRLQIADSSVKSVSGDVDYINVILRPKGRIKTRFV